MGVNKIEIVNASIRILDRDGFAGLSMRTIAAELNIKAASLYNHVRGKTELCGEIAEYMCAVIALPDETLGDADYLTAVARSYRAMLLTVRDSVDVFEYSPPVTPKRLEIIKLLMGRFIRLGVVSEDRLMTVSNLFNNFVLSFAADELRLKSRTPEEIRAMERNLNVINAGIRFGAMGERDFDEQFLFGLRLLLAGMEAVGRG